jgi:hypothetical protein
VGDPHIQGIQREALLGRIECLQPAPHPHAVVNQGFHLGDVVNDALQGCFQLRAAGGKALPSLRNLRPLPLQLNQIDHFRGIRISPSLLFSVTPREGCLHERDLLPYRL